MSAAPPWHGSTANRRVAPASGRTSGSAGLPARTPPAPEARAARPAAHALGPALRTAVLLLCFGVLWLCTFASPAFAEQDARKNRLYLTEVAMVVEGARRLLSWTEKYGSEPEFARFAHPMAERYVEMAGRLVPPEELLPAHPHILLVVENVERALDAAASADTSAFRQRARTVREELVTLESVLKQFKMRLPELPR
jgi:hypothetical protein